MYKQIVEEEEETRDSFNEGKHNCLRVRRGGDYNNRRKRRKKSKAVAGYMGHGVETGIETSSVMGESGLWFIQYTEGSQSKCSTGTSR